MFSEYLVRPVSGAGFCGLFGGVGYHLSKTTNLSLFGGLSFGGQLSLDDTNGAGISKTNYDTAGTLGFLFRTRF